MKDIKARCMNCEYERIVTAQNNYKFAACIKEPYHGKAVWEIEKCPLKTEEVAKLEKELADKTQWLDGWNCKGYSELCVCARNKD